MTDDEIEFLKGAMELSATMGSVLLWMPDHHTPARIVERVGPAPTVASDDEPEPSECAYLNGPGGRGFGQDHIALWNAELSQFYIAARLDHMVGQ